MGEVKAKKDRVTRHDLRHDGGKGKMLRTRTKRNPQLTFLFASILILSVCIVTTSANGPEWTAKSAWDTPDVGYYYTAPAFADLDGDGDYDLQIGEYTGVSFGYKNTASLAAPEITLCLKRVFRNLWCWRYDD